MATIEKVFWGMFWVVVFLIIFVFLANLFESKNVPFLGGVFGWAKQHAGVDY